MIHKAPETMTAKERVRRTFAGERTDRVPVDYSANPGIHSRLRKALGARDDEQVLAALGVDYRPVTAPYVGPLLFPEIEGCRVDPVSGCYTRWVANESGGYDDFCHFPLQGADPERIAAHPVPDPGHFDVGAALTALGRYPDHALYVGNAGMADVINSLGRIMGMEDALVNLATGDEATLGLVTRKADMEIGVLDRILARARGAVDFLWIGEDLGTQIAPMISLEMYRRTLRPVHERYVALAKAYDIPVMVHTCGSSSWAYEDFIEMGVGAVDTLQPEAVGMAPVSLKRRFGGRLSFHGCISTAGVLASGTPDQVRAEVRRTLAVMMPGGGYQFAPTHMIQDNTPVENVLAMYQAAHDMGRYPD